MQPALRASKVVTLDSDFFFLKYEKQGELPGECSRGRKERHQQATRTAARSRSPLPRHHVTL